MAARRGIQKQKGEEEQAEASSAHLHWTRVMAPSGGRQPAGSWQCHLEPGPLSEFLFCFVHLWHLPSPAQSLSYNLLFKALFLVGSSGEPLWVVSVPGIDLLGSAMRYPGCATSGLHVMYDLVLLSTSCTQVPSAYLCHKFFISLWTSWTCPLTLMWSWEQNWHLIAWKWLRFARSPVAQGKAVIGIIFGEKSEQYISGYIICILKESLPANDNFFFYNFPYESNWNMGSDLYKDTYHNICNSRKNWN